MTTRPLISLFLLLILSTVVAAQRQKDACETARIQLAGGTAPDLTLAEIKKDARCYDNGFVRVIGIYRVAFENSDLYDPTAQSARAWVALDPFYGAVKQCSYKNLKALDKKNGGTFGFVALGVVKTSGRFGHMGAWTLEFNPICLEKVELLSNNGFVFTSQPANEQLKISNWFKSEVKKRYD
jgi:hypothetical protein